METKSFNLQRLKGKEVKIETITSKEFIGTVDCIFDNVLLLFAEGDHVRISGHGNILISIEHIVSIKVRPE